VLAHLISAHALAVLILTSSSRSSPTRGATAPSEMQATFPSSDTLQETAHISEELCGQECEREQEKYQKQIVGGATCPIAAVERDLRKGRMLHPEMCQCICIRFPQPAIRIATLCKTTAGCKSSDQQVLVQRCRPLPIHSGSETVACSNLSTIQPPRTSPTDKKQSRVS
jgi:hypothetical protein